MSATRTAVGQSMRVAKKRVPMRIRLKFEHGQWWAYFNGWRESYFHGERLDWMCNAIAAQFPKGTMAAADYD